MDQSYEALLKKLKEQNIRLSHQRLKVLEYLSRHRCHPTVEQIFRELQAEVPTLSKTTIYNTLEVLIKAEIVRVVTIGGNETRYDIATDDHGHFKCESCGEIFDFTIELEAVPIQGLQDFTIVDRDAYFKGVCPRCL
jgi:Fur family peroxide stress response transcriptional regulator